MTVASFATLCFIEQFHLLKEALLMTRNHHLGNALTILNNEVFLRQIDEYHTYLATIISIDGTWRIEHGDTFLQRQSTTRSDLRLVASRQRDMQTSRNQPALERLQGDGGVEIGPEIHARTLRSGILRQGLMPPVDDFYFQHVVKISF